MYGEVSSVKSWRHMAVITKLAEKSASGVNKITK